MTTRSCGIAQQPPPPVSSPNRPVTPEKQVDPLTLSPPTSSLSSAPESLGSSPKELKASHLLANEGPTHSAESIPDSERENSKSGIIPETPTAIGKRKTNTTVGTGNAIDTGTGNSVATSPANKSRTTAARGRGGYRGNRGTARGRPGRARGRGGDSPDRNRLLFPENKVLISALKARQQELRKFFSTVGGYQADVLEQIASKDIARLVRKAKAHRQVPEHETVLDDIAGEREKATATIRRHFEIATAAELRRVEAEKEVTNKRFKITAENVRTEHIRGAEGDIVLLRNAEATLEDEARTNIGSENSEIAHFPRYHEFPESNVRVRGYYSNKITDERPFQHIEVSAQDQSNSVLQDHVLRDVINDDLIRPIEAAFLEKCLAERQTEAHERTQNMSRLCAVTEQELRKISNYTDTQREHGDGPNSFALSALADVAEKAPRRYHKPQYSFSAHRPRGSFQRFSSNWSRPMGTMPPPPAPFASPQRQPVQYVFQQPQHAGMPAGMNSTSNPPVMFVNSMARDKKGSAIGLAKGGKRMLLPKGYASQ